MAQDAQRFAVKSQSKTWTTIAKRFVLFDFVADPLPLVESPSVIIDGGQPLQIDTRHENFVNKECVTESPFSRA